jgi:hypothetical protein
VTDFSIKLRHRCRNPHCRTKLPAPVSNEREAFCCRGCYNSFYLHRCRVCEAPITQGSGQQRFVCKKAKCKSAWRSKAGFGRFLTPDPAAAIIGAKTLDFMRVKSPAKADRPSAKSRVKGWEWLRMLDGDGQPRTDDDWELFSRDGKMVARVRQEGDCYWMARPKVIPEPPLESLAAAKNRAEQIALCVYSAPLPDTERHPVHPGMTEPQYQATRRDMRKKHPEWSAQEVDQFIDRTLKPNSASTAILQRHHAPVNVLGGFKFPDAPAIDLSPIRSKPVLAFENSTPVNPSYAIPDDLSIPDFLRCDRRQAESTEKLAA